MDSLMARWVTVRARRVEEHHVVPGLDEVQGTQVGDDLSAQRALVVEVELLQGRAGPEAGGPDADLAAVGLPSGHLPLQAGGQELLVAPPVDPGPLAQPLNRVGQRRGLEGPAQVAQVGGRLGLGRHHATSLMRS